MHLPVRVHGPLRFRRSNPCGADVALLRWLPARPLPVLSWFPARPCCSHRRRLVQVLAARARRGVRRVVLLRGARAAPALPRQRRRQLVRASPLPQLHLLPRDAARARQHRVCGAAPLRLPPPAPGAGVRPLRGSRGASPSPATLPLVPRPCLLCTDTPHDTQHAPQCMSTAV